MKDEEKQQYKDLLLQQKNHNQTLIDNLKKEINDETQTSTSELSNYDNHPGDQGTDMFELEHNMGILNSFKSNSKDIDEAISYLESGNFGTCKECGKSIDLERLEILPQTAVCIDCAIVRDRIIKHTRESFKNKSTLSENIETPFGKKTVGDPLWAQHKGMDVLNETLKYGSAQSPQEAGNYKSISEYNDAMEEET